MIDSHLHSKYSHDGQAEIDDIVETALSLGLKYIAITDHIDRDYLFVGYDFFAQIDLSAYIEAVLTAKKKYKNKITIALGAELGYLPEANNSYLSELKGIPFDVILNSTHTVLGHDMYFPPFFEVAGSQENGYREYLKAVRSSLDVPYPYDIIAHLGYVQKNSPFPNNDLRYADYNEQFDDLLKTIIAYDKCLEVNTKINIRDAVTMPNYDILQHYFDLGGRKISFGSDAHRLPNIADKFKSTAAKMKEIGFEGFTYYINHQPYLDRF